MNNKATNSQGIQRILKVVKRKYKLMEKKVKILSALINWGINN